VRGRIQKIWDSTAVRTELDSAVERFNYLLDLTVEGERNHEEEKSQEITTGNHNKKEKSRRQEKTIKARLKSAVCYISQVRSSENWFKRETVLKESCFQRRRRFCARDVRAGFLFLAQMQNILRSIEYTLALKAGSHA
jgi:hypothetical protein